jgi:hypothetical protein
MSMATTVEAIVTDHEDFFFDEPLSSEQVP